MYLYLARASSTSPSISLAGDDDRSKTHDAAFQMYSECMAAGMLTLESLEKPAPYMLQEG